ncbi:hypothetical protein AAC387_Pa02g2460 [Persea americana]
MEVRVSIGGLPRHESSAKMMVAWFDVYHVVTVVVLKKKKKRRVTVEMGELVMVKMELRKGRRKLRLLVVLGKRWSLLICRLKILALGKSQYQTSKRGHEVVKMDVVQRKEQDFERGMFLQRR